MNTYDTTITAVYKGESRGNDWPSHAWEVTLTRGEQTMTLPYYMGLAVDACYRQATEG